MLTERMPPIWYMTPSTYIGLSKLGKKIPAELKPPTGLMPRDPSPPSRSFSQNWMTVITRRIHVYNRPVSRLEKLETNGKGAGQNAYRRLIALR
jgi:hypothetical protein